MTPHRAVRHRRFPVGFAALAAGLLALAGTGAASAATPTTPMAHHRARPSAAALPAAARPEGPAARVHARLLQRQALATRTRRAARSRPGQTPDAVSSSPLVTLSLPGRVVAGGGGANGSLTVDNTGADPLPGLDHVVPVLSLFLPYASPSQVRLSYSASEGGTPDTPVTLVPDPQAPGLLVGHLGPVTGAALPGGYHHSYPLRLAFAAGTFGSPLLVEADLVDHHSGRLLSLAPAALVVQGPAHVSFETFPGDPSGPEGGTVDAAPGLFVGNVDNYSGNAYTTVRATLTLGGLSGLRPTDVHVALQDPSGEGNDVPLRLAAGPGGTVSAVLPLPSAVLDDASEIYLPLSVALRSPARPGALRVAVAVTQADAPGAAPVATGSTTALVGERSVLVVRSEHRAYYSGDGYRVVGTLRTASGHAIPNTVVGVMVASADPGPLAGDVIPARTDRGGVFRTAPRLAVQSFQVAAEFDGTSEHASAFADLRPVTRVVFRVGVAAPRAGVVVGTRFVAEVHIRLQTPGVAVVLFALDGRGRALVPAGGHGRTNRFGAVRMSVALAPGAYRLVAKSGGAPGVYGGQSPPSLVYVY